MATLVKYRVHEVAKDFKMTSKVVTEILTKYATTPKNHMQVLEEAELDLIFEYLTQHNQMETLADVFAVPEKPKKAEPEKAPETEKAEKATEVKEPAKAEAQKPAAQQASQKPAAQAKPEKAFTPRPEKQKRVIDTSGVTINIEKYDERFDMMAGDRANNMKRGKEQIKKKGGQQKQNPATDKSAKRRQEERDRLRRLQFEVAKKAPVKVQIPDEINVGELASRMKKTGAEVVKALIKMGVMAGGKLLCAGTVAELTARTGTDSLEAAFLAVVKEAGVG